MKRRKEPPDPENPANKKKREGNCIIHCSSTSSSAPFTFLSEERFKYIKEIKDRRMQQPPGSTYRLMDICVQIPDELSPDCGYHKKCYQHFTRKY